MDHSRKYICRQLTAEQNITFKAHFKFHRWIDHGAHSLSCALIDEKGKKIAIKKIFNISNKTLLTKHALRHLRMLQHFQGHPNIIELYDIDVPNRTESAPINELYLYQEYMPQSLASLIKHGTSLSDNHVQFITYQILSGIKYIHSARVLHRNLKPRNIFIDHGCQIKISDFALARSMLNDEQNYDEMTEYVVTRWYRAPETILNPQKYTEAIDVWSIGCILAELLGKRPLFRGKDALNQLTIIFQVIGTPTKNSLGNVSEQVQDYISTLPCMSKTPFGTIFPNANPKALDLLDAILTYDVFDRLSIANALTHPYVRHWHDSYKGIYEMDCLAPINLKLDTGKSKAELGDMIWSEVVDFQAN